MKYALPVITLVAFASLFRCASQTRLAPAIRTDLQKRHVGRTVALKTSCYYGDLYDENEHWLLSPLPFADTTHINGPDQEPIHPSGQRGIVPAGTAFKIVAIEFPDAATMAKRMLMTPRFNPWVHLEPVKPESLRGRSSYVVVLPMDLENESAVEDALNNNFGPIETVQEWLQRRKPSVRTAIRHKDPVHGMTPAELTASWGKPLVWLEEDGAKIAWYRSQEVWFRADRISEIKNGREIDLATLK